MEGESTDGCLIVVVVAPISAVRNGWSGVEWNGMEWTYPAGMGVVVGGWGRDEWRMSKNKKGKGKGKGSMKREICHCQCQGLNPRQRGQHRLGSWGYWKLEKDDRRVISTYQKRVLLRGRRFGVTLLSLCCCPVQRSFSCAFQETSRCFHPPCISTHTKATPTTPSRHLQPHFVDTLGA